MFRSVLRLSPEIWSANVKTFQSPSLITAQRFYARGGTAPLVSEKEQQKQAEKKAREKATRERVVPS